MNTHRTKLFKEAARRHRARQAEWMFAVSIGSKGEVFKHATSSMAGLLMAFAVTAATMGHAGAQQVPVETNPSDTHVQAVTAASSGPVSEPPAPLPQAVVTAPPSAVPVERSVPREHRARRPVIGQATENLLALQRESVGRARPIPGDQASLSYARYLKSFEYAIPEKYESNVKSRENSSQ